MPRVNLIKDIVCFGSTTMGERGQVVIPVEIRKKLNLKNKNKFIVFFAPSGGIVLIPSNKFGEVVSEIDKNLDKLKKIVK